MSDKGIAEVGRELAWALAFRARERTPEANRKVLELMTRLCATVNEEEKSTGRINSIEARRE
jgi:hypothetical protein